MDYNCRDIPMKLDVNHQPLNFDIYLNHRIVIPRTCIDERPYDFQIELDALEKVNNILERSVSSSVINDSKPSPTTNKTDAIITNEPEINGSTLMNHILETEAPTIDTPTDPTIPPPIPPHRTLCNDLSLKHTTPAPMNPTLPETPQSISVSLVTVQPTCPREMPLMPTKNLITATKTMNDGIDTTEYSNNSNSITQQRANKSDNIQYPNQATQVNQINLRDFEDIHYNPFDHLELQTIDERRELGLVFQAQYAKSSSDESSVHRNHL